MSRYFYTLLFLFGLFFAQNTMANLCSKVTDLKSIPETHEEIKFYQTLFPNADYHGSLEYDGFVLECNRRRDNKGDEVRKILTRDDWSEMKAVLNNNDLSPYLFDAKYKFFGVAWFKMRYLIWKEKGTWHLLIPYKPIINDVVKDRIDFNMNHAAVLYEKDQVNESGSGLSKTYSLKSGALPISDTLCASTTFFEGKSKKYNGQNGINAHKRDRKNKHISLGQIEYSYKGAGGVFIPFEGCRVRRNVHLYGTNPITGNFERILPEDWMLNNFEKIAEDYWSIPANFELHVLLKGHNEGRLDQTVKKHVDKYIGNNDYLKIRFGTKFLPNANQMYKANTWQPNNFSMMTTDEIYLHEVGHAFGLDDEYAQGSASKKKKHCRHSQYNQFDGTSGTASFTIDDYMMCDGNGSQTNTIYHYLAVSRYVLNQRCKKDSDCGSGKYCNKRLGVNRCLVDRSLALNQSCTKNRECASKKCQGKGNKRMCVCNKNSDCPTGQACNNRLGQNRCLADATKSLGTRCNKNSECASKKCQGKGNKRMCVCNKNSDCAGSKKCKKPALKANYCK